MSRMSLRDAADTVPSLVRGPTCTVGSTLAAMDPDDREQLREWLADREAYQARRLGRILRAAGWGVGEDAIGRHRRGDCACLRS